MRIIYKIYRRVLYCVNLRYLILRSHVLRFVTPLPANFRADEYLALNPDLQQSDIDPTMHFLLYGRREQRIYEWNLTKIGGRATPRSDRGTILIVNHEASATGAPILGLNLARMFVEKYNVLSVFLGGGALVDALAREAFSSVVAPDIRGNPSRARALVDKICGERPFLFSIVNSIEARIVVEPLVWHSVPVVALIHEFAAYTRPESAFPDVFRLASAIVFSAKVTRADALRRFPQLRHPEAHVLPQGQCVVPHIHRRPISPTREHDDIGLILRPEGTQRSFLVVGMGFVQMRKGVDTFIQCASEVIRRTPSIPWRFVWVGAGYNPKSDLSYSVYLEDQVNRAGLTGYLSFAGSTNDPNKVYAEADVLLLTSRLDPMPNVAIDALTLGVPVLCFEHATGVADILIEGGLGSKCVARYLDIGDMAEKLIAITESDSFRKDIKQRVAEIAKRQFNMGRYVSELEALGLASVERTGLEEEGVSCIMKSKLFRKDFWIFAPEKNVDLASYVRSYVRSWRTGINRKKPFPGFNPGVYAAAMGLEGREVDPFEHYLLAGRPDGPWSNMVILDTDLMERKALPDNSRICLHIHAYYIDKLSEIVAALSWNSVRPDLFVSVADDDGKARATEILEGYSGQVVEVAIVPNKGRDIGPFLTHFLPLVIERYDYIGHLHTKKSVLLSSASAAEKWFQFLLKNLLGLQSVPMCDVILSRMFSDSSIGMVFPDDPHVLGFGEDLEAARCIGGRLGIKEYPECFNFPVGTMFWASSAGLRPMMTLGLGWDDYPEEPLPYDGTMLHALERLFPLSLAASNLTYATTNVHGVTR